MRYASCVLVLWTVLVAAVNAETLTGRVVRVSDGDTITVRDANSQRHRIRIAGIDAPENRQNFGRRSRQNLSRLVLEQDARLDCHKTDRNEPKVCKVWVQPPDCSSCGKTLDVGLAQVVAGLAWWYREHAKEQSEQDGRYESSEDEARLRHRGLWGDPKPVPPWQWRDQHAR